MSEISSFQKKEMQSINLDENSPSSSKQSNKYQPLKKDENKSSGYPIFSKIKVILELSFILLAFFLALKKAISTFLNKDNPDGTSKLSSQNNLANENKIIRKETNDLKICICTVGKKENRYIKEFVQFYEKFGVDKIYLYDYNNVNDEKFSDVISDYINNGFVEVLDWRGKNEYIGMLNDCYQKYYQQYDWLMFYDIDEYIHLKNYGNIKPFLNDEKFNNCKKIYLNWVFHTDNDLLYYDNRTLQERFPFIESKPSSINNESLYYIKSIIRGNLTNITVDCKYKLSNQIKGCNGFGQEEPNLLGFNFEHPDFENYYIDHYFYKSVQEFVEKLSLVDYDIEFKNETIGRFFQYNNVTYEKIDYIENKTGVNLSLYRNILNERSNKTN